MRRAAACLLLTSCSTGNASSLLPNGAPSASATVIAHKESEPSALILAASEASVPSAAPLEEHALARYLPNERHAPLTASVVTHARQVLAEGNGRSDVFTKVGDSITASGAFLHCFAGDDVRWGEHQGLDDTRAFFSKTLADSSRSSFARTSMAAEVGWLAWRPLEGSRTPLSRELAVTTPALAVVLFGTNDTYPDGMHGFHTNLGKVIHALLDAHVLPLMSTIPPRRDKQEAARLVPHMNAVIRAMAQDEQLPLMDLHGALASLPRAGLSDGIHPSAFEHEGGLHPCWFEERALTTAGMNVRNLLVLEALDHVRRKVLGDELADSDTSQLTGRGTTSEPLRVDALPFVDARDARDAAQLDAAQLSATCRKPKPSGPSVAYAITLDRPTRLVARVFPAEPGADLDLLWLPSGEPGACSKHADRTLEVTAPAGTHQLVVTPNARRGSPRAGRYRLTLLDASE